MSERRQFEKRRETKGKERGEDRRERGAEARGREGTLDRIVAAVRERQHLHLSRRIDGEGEEGVRGRGQVVLFDAVDADLGCRSGGVNG